MIIIINVAAFVYIALCQASEWFLHTRVRP